jgi:hypothetical protein
MWWQMTPFTPSSLVRLLQGHVTLVGNYDTLMTGQNLATYLDNPLLSIGGASFLLPNLHFPKRRSLAYYILGRQVEKGLFQCGNTFDW